MVNGYIRAVFDRLPGIRSNKVRNDDNWQEWEFPQFVTALEKWTQRTRYLIMTLRMELDIMGKKSCKTPNNTKRSVFIVKIRTRIPPIVKSLRVFAETKKILMEKRLCFNCTSKQHRGSDCQSKRTCSTCNERHHSSICSKPYPSVPTVY